MCSSWKTNQKSLHKSYEHFNLLIGKRYETFFSTACWIFDLKSELQKYFEKWLENIILFLKCLFSKSLFWFKKVHFNNS